MKSLIVSFRLIVCCLFLAFTFTTLAQSLKLFEGPGRVWMAGTTNSVQFLTDSVITEESPEAAVRLWLIPDEPYVGMQFLSTTWIKADGIAEATFTVPWSTEAWDYRVFALVQPLNSAPFLKEGEHYVVITTPITSPNEDTNVKAGQKMTLTWVGSDGKSATYTISITGDELEKDITIGDVPATKGKYEFVLPKNTPEGKYYLLLDGAGGYATSEEFGVWTPTPPSPKSHKR